MSVIFRIVIGCTFLCGSLVFARSASVQQSHDPILAIEEDFLSGQLTLDQRVLLEVTAIRRPAQLPAQYQMFDSVAKTTTSRSATLALRRVVTNWNQLAPPTQVELSSMLTRWSTAYSHVSPAGAFRLHYDVAGTNAVPPDDINGNNVPDFVEKCASYCDTSLATQLRLGFVFPPNDGGAGGDTLFDVYFEEMGYYGYAVPENPGPAPWADYTSYLVLHRNFLSFPSNTDPEGNQAGAAKATVAHEFHHCIQFAYNVNADDWYMELDATATEDIVFDHVNDNYNYLPTFFNAPSKSLMESTFHMYSCFIWGLYLTQKFDTSLLTAVWQGARYSTVYNSLSDTLVGRYGWTQDSAFADFVTWNYVTKTRADASHYRDAALYPLAGLDGDFSTYPVASQTRNASGYGSSYVRFTPTGTPTDLYLTFDGDDSHQWAAYVITSTSATSHQFQKLELSPGTYVDTAVIADFKSYSSVTLVGINLSEYAGVGSFVFSASLRKPYALASTALTDSSVYSGGDRPFSFCVKNVSLLTDQVDITVTDTRNWSTFAPLTSIILAGDSVIVVANIRPPAGTWLGTRSQITLTAISRPEPAVKTIQVVPAVAVVQRGDLDFNGGVDISDVTWIVDYLMTGVPSPYPIPEAGNCDCQGGVDIGDVMSLVDYLTGSGPRPPCNPY